MSLATQERSVISRFNQSTHFTLLYNVRMITNIVIWSVHISTILRHVYIKHNIIFQVEQYVKFLLCWSTMPRRCRRGMGLKRSSYCTPWKFHSHLRLPQWNRNPGRETAWSPKLFRMRGLSLTLQETEILFIQFTVSQCFDWAIPHPLHSKYTTFIWIQDKPNSCQSSSKLKFMKKPFLWHNYDAQGHTAA